MFMVEMAWLSVKAHNTVQHEVADYHRPEQADVGRLLPL